MRFGVAIATVDRTDALRALCAALQNQTCPPVAIAICAPDAAAIPQDIVNSPGVSVVGGVRGASAQRNAAVKLLPDTVEAIAFFDDDAIPRFDYLENAGKVLETHPQLVGITGTLLRDGASEGHAIPAEELQTALRDSLGMIIDGPDSAPKPTTRLYGNNMVVRAPQTRCTPFDERLVLYSWLEDLDFSSRLLKLGALAISPSLIAVHQGSDSGGRTQHKRLGYSQIANVVYLHRKSSITMLEALQLGGRPLLACVKCSLLGPDREDRRQRLGGMALAMGDIARGRVTPERITTF